MSKNIVTAIFLLLNLAFIGEIHSTDTPSTESLSEILKMKEDQREKKIIRLFYNRYFFSSSFDSYLTKTLDSLKQIKRSDVAGMDYLGQILILRRKFELGAAEQTLYKAIDWAQKANNRYLLFHFYQNLAFTKTDKKDELHAIHSYRLARREAIALKDKTLLASTDLGIANVYAALQLFDQSLFYLNQVGNTCTTNEPGDRKFTFFSYLSKAGVFFFMRNADSLRVYTKKAIQLNKEIYNAQKELDRLHYYNLILAGNYKEAISIIEALLKAEATYFGVDNLNLANCFFKIGDYVKASSLARRLTPDSVKIAAHIKIEAYTLLGKIAQYNGNGKELSAYQAAALNESEAYNKNITRVADLSSQIRLDQMDAFYQAQTSIYKKERVILVFTLLAVALGALIIGIFYYSIRQKRRYERLLQESRDKELTFLNSHKTRKHLANILGLCTLVKATNPEEIELLLYFEYVSNAATEMDEWLREVNERLTAQKRHINDPYTKTAIQVF